MENMDSIITVEEAVACLREQLKMKISPPTLREGIAQGQFPFGSYIKTEKSCVCYIYSVLLLDWIKARHRHGGETDD